MSKSHLTLSFPLKASADAKAMAEELPPLMPELFRAEDAMGTVHYSRFTVLSDKTLLCLADFDGEFRQLMLNLAKHAGPVFDGIFKHVTDPPPAPSQAMRTVLPNGPQVTFYIRLTSTAPIRDQR